MYSVPIFSLDCLFGSKVVMWIIDTNWDWGLIIGCAKIGRLILKLFNTFLLLLLLQLLINLFLISFAVRRRQHQLTAVKGSSQKVIGALSSAWITNVSIGCDLLQVRIVRCNPLVKVLQKFVIWSCRNAACNHFICYQTPIFNFYLLWKNETPNNFK